MSEKLRKTGATLSTILTLGGLTALGVEAGGLPDSASAANTPAHINKESGNGNHIIYDPVATQAEAYQAFTQIHKRWQGVIVVHAPKLKGIKNSVGFNRSPNSGEGLEYAPTGDTVWFPAGQDAQVAICFEPALVHFKGRDYLVVYEPITSQYGYLDLKEAERVGSITAYAIEGEKSGPIDYNPMKPAIMPNISVISMDQVPNSKSVFNLTPQDAHVPAQNPDGSFLHYKLKHSSVMPHL